MRVSTEVITLRDTVPFGWYVVEGGMGIISDGNTVQRTPANDSSESTHFTGDNAYDECGFAIKDGDLDRITVREVLEFENK